MRGMFCPHPRPSCQRRLWMVVLDPCNREFLRTRRRRLLLKGAWHKLQEGEYYRWNYQEDCIQISYSAVARRLWRIRGSFSQEEFAKKIGIPYWTYCRCESGKRMPSVQVLLQIKKHMNVSIDLILSGKERSCDSIPFTEPVLDMIIDHYGSCIVCNVSEKLFWILWIWLQIGWTDANLWLI